MRAKTVSRRAIACALVATCAGATVAHAAEITHRLMVQPIQVRDDAGANPANAARQLYEAINDKIWMQAGIDIMFMDWKTLDKTSLLTLEDGDSDGDFIDEVLGTPNNQADAGAKVVNMWFVNSISDGTTTAAGEVDAIPGKNLVISDAVFTLSRIDTIAHELGHILGLTHASAGVDNKNLMRSGLNRTIPGAIGDITPDGAKLSVLTPAQILTAKGSGLLKAVPTPATLALLSLSGLVAARRRRAA